MKTVWHVPNILLSAKPREKRGLKPIAIVNPNQHSQIGALLEETRNYLTTAIPGGFNSLFGAVHV
jgi:hypothetical protein